MSCEAGSFGRLVRTRCGTTAAAMPWYQLPGRVRRRSAEPAGAQLLRLADLVRVRAAVLGAGGLQHGRQPLEPRGGEEHSELLAELPLEDVRVPVAVRAEGRGGVVDVQSLQPVEADRGLQLVEAGVQSGRVGHIYAGHPEVAGVEADAEPRVPSHPLVDRGELLDRAADRAARPG